MRPTNSVSLFCFSVLFPAHGHTSSYSQPVVRISLSKPMPHYACEALVQQHAQQRNSATAQFDFSSRNKCGQAVALQQIAGEGGQRVDRQQKGRQKPARKKYVSKNVSLVTTPPSHRQKIR
ncbi:hypothetical protein GOU96_17850 [Vibrio sp. R-1]|uniref:hypothetical protein n=1 Tax=Vibrio sp. R-1 TaxID=2682542 RepID=UPI002D1F4CD2|nr:hypothetical protein [Vibrio sp. R-1]MEB3778451.1 hypothetical protein [Vibrio sp. R-1]